VPNDLSIYQQAFLHRSSSIKTDKGKWINNERLEFLGDAVLDAVVADVVFHKFDTKKEGFLTNTRSKIVQRETLNKLALQLGLDKLVKSATRTVSHNNYMYGNAFEAFIGAIYVDQGYDACKKFIEERVIAPYIDLVKLSRKEVNFKSKLIEWSQKNKVKISFDLIESFNDEDNNPVFQTQVSVCGIAGGIGIGYSKKESQQNASKSTMKKIQNDPAFRAELDAAKAALKKAKNASAAAAKEAADATSEVEAPETTDAAAPEQQTALAPEAVAVVIETASDTAEETASANEVASDITASNEEDSVSDITVSDENTVSDITASNEEAVSEDEGDSEEEEASDEEVEEALKEETPEPEYEQTDSDEEDSDEDEDEEDADDASDEEYSKEEEDSIEDEDDSDEEEEDSDEEEEEETSEDTTSDDAKEKDKDSAPAESAR
jgi:ribonuclease-3